jgi:RNA-binding protein NOB1
MYKKMMLSYENGFGFDDVDLKQSRGKAKIKVGYGRLNPNDVQDMKKIKSKRHK